MKIQAEFGSCSKSGFALLEVVMTLIMVSLALGAAAMVLGTAVKVVQQRSMMDARSLKAANCMARIEAAFQGRKLSDIQANLTKVCRNGAKVDLLLVSTYPSDNDDKGRKNYEVTNPPPDPKFLLVSVTADNKTYRRLFSHPELSRTQGPEPTVSTEEEGR